MPYEHTAWLKKYPLGWALYLLILGKACHLPIELEHRAYWVIKEINMDINKVRAKQLLQHSELTETNDVAYNNVKKNKKRTNHYHDKA